MGWGGNLVKTASLPMIAALLRAGAVDRAASLFEAGGFAANQADPAALAVKGRLLKAYARRAPVVRRQELMGQAAEAYAAANALAPAPYLAINAATLHLLAGDGESAESGAQAVLDLLDAPVAPADTPYFLAATRAEARLLLGDEGGARLALAQAVAHDPDGWDDRASTLVQLREIIARQGGDPAWLDRFAPPVSLHFAGHMGLAAGGAGEAELAAELDRLLPQLNIGFAWGALAAGADIIIAERLMQSGVEVHAVLPCPPDRFVLQSVAPAGDAWVARFRALLDAVASLSVADPDPATRHDPLATAFAGELAIGGALRNAARYAAPACQLIVADEQGGGANTARQAAMWHGAMGPRHTLRLARDAAVEALFPPEQPDPARVLALHLAIGLDLPERGIGSAEIAAQTAPIGRALAALPAGTVRASAGLWELATTDIGAGLDAIAAVLAACGQAGTTPPSIGAHLAIGTLLSDPASGTAVPYGPAPDLARRIMRLAPPGLALASDPLAVTLAARADRRLHCEAWLPDEPDLGGTVHALIPRDQ